MIHSVFPHQVESKENNIGGFFEHDFLDGIDKMLFPKAVVRIADKKTGAYMLNIRFRYSRLLSLRASIFASIGYMFFSIV